MNLLLYSNENKYFQTMNRSIITLSLISIFSFSACSTQQKMTFSASDSKDVQRIIETLADDDMRGRSALVPEDIGKAADFIAAEFKSIGLQPYAEANFRQSFEITQINLSTKDAQINGKDIDPAHILIQSTMPGLNWNANPEVSIEKIAEGEDFSQRFRSMMQSNKDLLVMVDPSFASSFDRLQRIYSKGRIINEGQSPSRSIVFILSHEVPQSFRVNFTNSFQKIPLFNVAGILPGKSKKNEYVIFSGHYDHIGILEAVGQDSIANGADDDASGVTAMISLAKHFKKLNSNERTLIFIAFTAEEIGMYGSKYFSENIDADQVVAMINIEMIGKNSKFGENSLYVTGFNNSNLAALMQKEVSHTKFKFFPDPYPAQNLFYRSDNAILAALGVPAHTFSTVQIDKDNFYHTVKDEVSTLNIKNIVSSIEAIAIGTKAIVEGQITPSRVEKLKD